MLAVPLILIITVCLTNGFPPSPHIDTEFEQRGEIFPSSEQQQIIFRAPEQKEVILQIPEQQGIILQAPDQKDVVFQTSEQQGGIVQASEQQQETFQTPVEQEDIFHNSEQELNQNQPNEDYFTSGNTNLAEQQTDFTISCIGANRICTSTNDCINGYIHFAKTAAYSTAQIQECRVQDQVCCTIKETSNVKSNINRNPLKNYNPTTVPEQKVVGVSTQFEISPSSNTFATATHLQLGCAAALLCVEEKFCALDGMISPEPVTLSESQLFRRVPLSSCRNPENGIIGKCCRDPNYVDPWPTGNLPANYSGGFDEQGFPTFLNIAKVRPPKTSTQPATTAVKKYPVKTQQKSEPTLVSENSDIFSKTLVPPSGNKDVNSDLNRPETKLRCGVRNQVAQQPELEAESKTAFAEIPWQAMVLQSKERKILCSGVLVSTQDVLTAANCVNSLLPSDISIKLGEWKLGYELKYEEPLPFQIIDVSSISIHPGYTQGYEECDLAMLHLESPATFDFHINPLCLPTSNSLAVNNKPCITTGWGKSILQAHYAGAIMHAVSMDILPTESCKERLISTNFETDIANRTICAVPKEEKNNVCETDIGGPLACLNEHGSYDLAGIYSQDTGCQPTNQVAIFAPLDQTWLKETMFKSTSEESKTNILYDKQLFTDDYRKSTLSTNNQYLPPV
ncbi:inactive serine protease scarface [Xylocopa sonorina]|uniref:inactive serine protease scarface n=1 Tax=Xylocopa sonorina TaxID=1818115 RepID=UPI00403AA7D8